MFTGIIEEIGKIQSVTKGEISAKISINAKKVLEDVKLGDSISTNGVCLTVTNFTRSNFTVDVMAETMRRTNLSILSQGAEVNLERALKVGDRFGGHIVSGHIDGTGRITEFKKEDNAIWVTIRTDSSILKYIIPKGSIAIDGISLTVAYVDEEVFKVSVIPHTKDFTTLLHKNIGDMVNLECDLVGKYIEKLISFEDKKQDKNDLSENFLREHGFA